MLDHLTLIVTNFERSKAFYLRALQPLGASLVMELTREQYPGLPFEQACGMGAGGKPSVWLRPGASVQPTHVAFAAPDRAAVRAFYEAAIAAGGRDNGGPGLRPEYHASYYGAFVLDPDGYNIEAVCHAPQ